MTLESCACWSLTHSRLDCSYKQRRDRYAFEQDRIHTAMTYEETRAKGQVWHETNVTTIRGLEDLLAAESKESSRRQHVHLVLRAAARIRHEGYASEEAFCDTLRYVSSGSSAWARQRARDMGVADAAALAWL